METQVDPAVLDTAAGRCASLAQRLDKAVAAVQPDSRAAVAGLGSGFLLRSALERVLASRVDEFGRFERYLGQVGEALTATAADYRRSDAVSADRFAFLREG
ncbi:type VII secretion target [Actinoplanes sp. NPDC049681]|uniref:type VII secretion target n=1 Tax=Actinoplanes sp. NPDC049681 TaxID=3363905 RepID=UPI0037B0DFC2